MPFENLGDKLQSAFKDLRGKGRLSESDIDSALREVRRALLEADVNFKVAKDFIAQVREKAVGEEVFGSLKPDQTVIKIVRDELTELLGGTQSKITMSSSGLTVIMLVGLQGAGKTTTAGKLALMLKKRGKKPGPYAEEARQETSFGGVRRVPSCGNQAAGGSRTAGGCSRIPHA